MTIEKASRLQNDLRELFRKYGVTSGMSLFMHGGTLHPIEAHVTEKNELIVKLMDGMTEAAKQASDIPVWEHWTPQDDN